MAVPPDSPSATFQVDCDPSDPFYEQLYKRASSSGGAGMQFLGNMIVEVRMLPKEPTDQKPSK
jgi:hypothetical protein